MINDMDVVADSQETETIQPINRDTVHRICSGQVVLSLATAVKELVENALDAGATIINIHLKEFGSEVIEVSDNGPGIKKENFQYLTLKHYTSKIQRFDDLKHLTTLGFRGEALSSLCALSELTVLTKHNSDEYATKIKYNRNGKIVSETVAAREQGTSVTLENLFCTLPVRRKEFLKNLKREFNKMCNLLHAYCLISKNVKFLCINTVNNKRNVVVSTDGLNSIRNNIINLFGTKQISSLIEVEPQEIHEEILQEYNVEGERLFTFEFFISSPLHGSGRSSADRQFFYINSRPCEPSKVIKLVNETYKQYNAQSPFICLNILTKSTLIDVNVTPDKRQIFLENENNLLACLKSALVEAFKVFPSTFKMQNLDKSINEEQRGIKRSHSEPTTKKGSIFEKFKKRSKTENDKEKTSPLEKFLTCLTPRSESTNESIDKESTSPLKVINEITDNSLSCEIIEPTTTPEKKNETDDSLINEAIEEISTITCRNIDEEIPKRIKKVTEEQKTSVNKDGTRKSVQDLSVSRTDTPEEDHFLPVVVTLDWTIEKIMQCLEKQQPKEDSVKVRFRSKIEPNSNKSAEDELNKHISKEDFARMDIIGQFNLGFIVTKLNRDLFIVDQHASDEIYNFEDLQRNTVLENQVLVNPKPLQLTAGNESLLIENEEIFLKNGFKFAIDLTAPCTKKISLTSVPFSKNVVFGTDDIDEILFMLKDSNHVMCRPTKIRSMFASRACRKSVMIGKALSRNDMRKIINHMGEMDKPWNCPHGRPTMRHLINLDLIHRE